MQLHNFHYQQFLPDNYTIPAAGVKAKPNGIEGLDIDPGGHFGFALDRQVRLYMQSAIADFVANRLNPVPDFPVLYDLQSNRVQNVIFLNDMIFQI